LFVAKGAVANSGYRIICKSVRFYSMVCF